MTDCVENYFRLFIQAARGRDWAAFPAAFVPDAALRSGGAQRSRPWAGDSPEKPS